MQEIGIAGSILKAVETEAALYPEGIVRKVGVNIGILAAVDPDALRFCFETLTQDTEFAGLRLEITTCPQRAHCTACSLDFVVSNYETQCPHCGQPETQCIGGEELELAYLELAERVPRTT